MKKITFLALFLGIIILAGCASKPQNTPPKKQEVVNCDENYECLYQQLSNKHSAKMVITEKIKSLSLIEKSEIKVQPLNNQYQIAFQIIDLKKIKKDKPQTKSIVGSLAKTCPQILNNLDKIKSKQATCVTNTALEAKQLALDGLSDKSIKKYNCAGDLINTINQICVTSNSSIFPPGVKKPAIYLYPEKKSQIEIHLNINGFITKAKPNYLLGWKVLAQPNGLINNKYDYLFYEAHLNKLELPQNGWIVKYSDLNQWFDENLPLLGLNQKETAQFKEYWTKQLTKTNYYEIKLLEKEFLDKNMKLTINPQPTTLIRLNFYFKPLSQKIKLEKPQIETPQRKGFTAVEWGGLLDN